MDGDLQRYFETVSEEVRTSLNLFRKRTEQAAENLPHGSNDSIWRFLMACNSHLTQYQEWIAQEQQHVYDILKRRKFNNSAGGSGDIEGPKDGFTTRRIPTVSESSNNADWTPYYTPEEDIPSTPAEGGEEASKTTTPPEPASEAPSVAESAAAEVRKQLKNIAKEWEGDSPGRLAQVEQLVDIDIGNVEEVEDNNHQSVQEEQSSVSATISLNHQEAESSTKESSIPAEPVPVIDDKGPGSTSPCSWDTRLRPVLCPKRIRPIYSSSSSHSSASERTQSSILEVPSKKPTSSTGLRPIDPFGRYVDGGTSGNQTSARKHRWTNQFHGLSDSSSFSDEADDFEDINAHLSLDELLLDVGDADSIATADIFNSCLPSDNRYIGMLRGNCQASLGGCLSRPSTGMNESSTDEGDDDLQFLHEQLKMLEIVGTKRVMACLTNYLKTSASQHPSAVVITDKDALAAFLAVVCCAEPNSTSSRQTTGRPGERVPKPAICLSNGDASWCDLIADTTFSMSEHCKTINIFSIARGAIPLEHTNRPKTSTDFYGDLFIGHLSEIARTYKDYYPPSMKIPAAKLLVIDQLTRSWNCQETNLDNLFSKLGNFLDKQTKIFHFDRKVSRACQQLLRRLASESELATNLA